ncbi:hypothetical protein L9F63_027767, partial [Diploptera punctata]
VNANESERYAALLEDASAFGFGASVTGVTQFIIGAAAIAILNFGAQKQIARVRQLFLQSVLRQDMSWYDTTKTANFASRLTEILDKMQDGIGEKLSIFLYLLTTFIASVIMSFLKGWKLTLVVLSCAPVIIISQAIVAKVQSSLTVQELESYGDAGAVAEEVLSSIRTVCCIWRFKEKLKKAKATGIKRGIFSGLGGGTMWFIIYCSYAVAFWYGVTLILESRANGNYEYTPDILVIHLQLLEVQLLQFFQYCRRVPEIDSLDESGNKPPSLQGVIKLEGVHFQYPARPEVQVLKGLNLTVKTGESVALVGSSGCGKSTIIQLVQRLYDPSQGRVLIDGNDVKQLNVGWLRSHIGVVGQEPVLFGTTIRENIRYGRLDASQEEIEEAAREANAHDFISKLPEGYETMVGERGTQLSGGQNSVCIRSSSKRDTTLVVTHRLSTVRNADRIVFISGGEVVEEGTHHELMALQGHYYNLVQSDPTLTHNDGSGDIEELDNGSDIVNLPRQMSLQSQTGSAHGPIDVSALDHHSGTSSSRSFHIQQMTKKSNMKWLYHVSCHLNKPEWIHCVIGCIAATAIGCTLPVFAVLFGEVLGVLQVTDPEEVQSQANFYSILFVVVGIVTGGGMFLQTYCFGLAGVRLTQRLRVQAFSAMLRQEIGWFDEEKNSVGTLCAKLSGDAASVQGATGSRIGVILQATSTLAIGIILSFTWSWKNDTCFIKSRVMHGQGLSEKKAIEAATKIAIEAISNIRTVVSLSREQLFLQRYMTELQVALAAARKKSRFRGPVYSLGQTAPFFGYGLSLYYGGVLISTEGLPYKNVIKVSEALIFGAWMLGQGLAFAPNYSIAKMAAGRMFRLMDRKPRIPLAPDGNEIKEGTIEYSRVRFQYPTRPEVAILRGLNLNILQGKTVALVGPSGCGKSTCIQLLQRFYEPSSGSLLSGRDISSLPLKTLRSQLGIVSQEPVLFDRTIAENIAYGDNNRTVPMDEIIESAKKSNIHNFISSLPLTGDTVTRGRLAALSQGEPNPSVPPHRSASLNLLLLWTVRHELCRLLNE